MARYSQAEQRTVIDDWAEARAVEAEARARVWTAALVAAALEEAGKALLALPPDHEFPDTFRVAWPEIVRAVREGDRAPEGGMPPALPSAQAIAAMEFRLRWAFRYCASVPKRRLVGARMLVNPLSEKHLWSWGRLAGPFRVHRDTVKRWHSTACGEIAAGLNRDGVEVKIPLV